MHTAKPQTAALQSDHHEYKRVNQLNILIKDQMRLDKMHILEYSLYHIRMVILANIVCLFIYCSHASIWVSFVTETDTFNVDSDQFQIAFVVWIKYIILSILGFILCIFGQIVGYDKCVTLLIFITLIGCIIECVANNFFILTIGYLISQLSFLMIYITICYISWCLPFECAITYISYNYATIILFGFSGSLCSSFIAYIFSYKIAFIIDTSLLSIVLFLTLISIFGKQRKLQVEQFEIDQLYERYHKSTASSISLQHELFPIFVQEAVGENIFNLIVPTKLEWYFLFHYVLQIGLLYGATTTFYIYYTQYVTVKYTEESAQSVADLHLLSSSVAGAWGILIARFIVLGLSFKFERMFILFGLCIKLGIFGFAFIQTTELYLNYVWCSLSMFIAGSLLIVFEKLLLEIQTFPKETGKINGIKCIVTNVVRAICVLAPGILWEISIDSLFYSLAAMMAIMILLEMVYTILIWKIKT